MTAPTDVSTETAFEAARAEAVLARRTLWLTAERIVFSTGMLVAAVFGWFQTQDGAYGLWSFLWPPDRNPLTRWVGGWTLLTMLLVVAALATPGGMLGTRRRWATVAALGLLTAAHLVVLMTYAGAPFFSVHPTYGVLIVLAAASTCVWWPRAGIDEVV